MDVVQNKVTEVRTAQRDTQIEVVEQSSTQIRDAQVQVDEDFTGEKETFEENSEENVKDESIHDGS